MKASLFEVVLAIDFSLGHLDIALQTPTGTWHIPHRRYDNNLFGFSKMKRDILLYLESLDTAQLTAAGESSGLYWWHAFQQIATDPDFAPYSPQLALMNPAHVKHFRKALPETEKSDQNDPQLIGRYYTTVGIPHYYTFDLRYLPLRFLTRAYCRLIHTLAAEKAYALSLVYLLASEYHRKKPFSEVFGLTSRQVLTEYPDISAIADVPVEQLAAELNIPARGQLKDPLDTAKRLHHVAQSSYPVPDELRPVLTLIFTDTLDHIRFLEQQQADYANRISAALEELPEADLALEVKGLGPILVAGCLSEIQDTRRFTTGQKYDQKRKRWRERTYRDGQAGVATLRVAGLWWPRHDSGQFVAQNRRLARERNPYLRFWFVQVAYSLKGNQADYAVYYQKKYRETLRHKHQRALILTARKAVRLIFALLHKGQMDRHKEEVTEQ